MHSTANVLSSIRRIWWVPAAILLMGQSCPSGPIPCPAGTTCFYPLQTLASGSIDVESCGGDGGLGGDNLTTPPGEVLAGWDYSTYGNRLGSIGLCQKAQYNYRGGVLFDASYLATWVKDSGLISATLVFQIPASNAGEPIPYGYLPSPWQCLGHLGAANIDWASEQPGDYKLIPYDDFFDVPANLRAPYNVAPLTLTDDASSGNVLTAAIDVTALVRQWAINPEANNGFVLAGDNESGEPANGACVSQLNNFQLRLVPFR